MTHFFSNEEKTKIVERFKDGVILSKLGQKFGCSYRPIVRILIAELGIAEYKKIAEEHFKENCRKIGRKAGPENGRKRLIRWKKENPEKVLENAKKWLQLGQKAHLSIYEKLFKKLLKMKIFYLNGRQLLIFQKEVLLNLQLQIF